jgi:eukaryotic-like serine/threonine-protein kinase
VSDRDDLVGRLRSALAERYAVDRQIGQGGMATVIAATDLKHNRPVAIKVLRPELAATIGPERFLREIEVSAGLQHPHIIPLYDSGSAGGILYYVMPLVEGESLRDRLTRTGTVGFAEAVTLTREVASALQYAHGHGVVHRDIKPENIMLSGGHAVVADFGIARALRAAAQGQQLTGLGIAIGTPAYMSPEQATASEVDARSDQYSLACVFYEMVSGKAPFAGPTVQAVLTRSLTGPRPRLSRVNRSAPAEVDGPVARALAADPNDRYASVSEFAEALEGATGSGAAGLAERRRLRRLAVGLPALVAVLAGSWIVFGPRRGGPVMKEAETIAVLPFTTSGSGVELMGEGMVDLLSTNLNAVGGIRAVNPRTVMVKLKESGLSAGAIDVEKGLRLARSMHAQAALLGSIVASGPRARLSADLYGPAGQSLAHAQVDGPSDSVLTLVDQLSLALVREIWRSKEPVPSLRVSGITTSSLAAMREYLVGEQSYRHSAWDSAAAAFARATEQDSTFALAYYRLALALGWKAGYGNARALAASGAALRFAGRLPPRERVLVTAYDLFTQGRLAAADTLRRYVAQYPDDADGWYLLGESQFHTKQLTGLAAAQLRDPFDRVLALDSTLTPAAIHPLETALADRDSAGFARYLGIMRMSADPAEAAAFAAAGRLVWESRSPDSTEAAALLHHMGATLAAFAAAEHDPAATSDKVLAGYDRLAQSLLRINPPTDARNQMVGGRALVLMGHGRFTEAMVVVDSARRLDPGQANGLPLFPLTFGFAPPGFAGDVQDQLLKARIQNPFQAFFVSALLLNRGDLDRAGKLIDSVARDTTKLPGFLRGAFIGARGWRELLVGDTVRGIQDLRFGSERVGNSMMFNGRLRLELGAALAARPATRDEGLALLRNAFATDLGVQPIAYYALGRAAEKAGRKEEALAAYGQFARLWDKADSSAQPRVREAKEAMTRLAGEPRQ